MGHVLSPAGGGQEGLLGAGWEPGPTGTLTARSPTTLQEAEALRERLKMCGIEAALLFHHKYIEARPSRVPVRRSKRRGTSG